MKAFLSSPSACESTIDARLRHKDMQAEDDEDVAHDQDVLKQLKYLVQQVSKRDFSKYGALLTRLKGFGYDRARNKDRVVIFSERIDTLEFLKANLQEDLSLKDEQVVIFHGSLDDTTQQDLVKSFGTESSPIRILLASDVASEGVNLHFFCHRMVHFDLPWSLITLEQRNGRIDRFGQNYPPEIYYLLTVPTDNKLAGDLRILERLIEKEEYAQKNLGDVAWLLNLHEAEKEEEHIAAAIEEGREETEVIPDAPEHTDFMDILFGDEQPEGISVQRRSPPSIYPEDLTYVLDGFREIFAGQDGQVEHHEELDGFTLYPPQDLTQRFKYLPRELTRDVKAFKLTTERQRVMDSLESAREKHERWPEWQLFWEQSPVAQWLDDRVLGAFTRHSAPVIAVNQGLAVAESVFLFQGVISNRRGQPAIIEWLGVQFDEEEPTGVLTIDEVITRFGLAQALANPDRSISSATVEQLHALRESAVEHARSRMRQVRNARAQELAEPLRDGLRKLKAWQQKSLDRLGRQQSMLGEMAGAARTQKEKRLEREAQEVQRLYQSRHKWIEESMRTIETPYIRLAAVFAPRESR